MEDNPMKMSRSLLTYILFLGKRYEMNVSQLWDDYQESIQSFDIRRRNVRYIQEQSKGKKKEDKQFAMKDAKQTWKNMSERDRIPYYQLSPKIKKEKKKRVLNRYNVYCQTNMPIFRKQYPHKRPSELLSMISQKWKEETKNCDKGNLSFYREDLHEHFRPYLEQKRSIYNDTESELFSKEEERRRCQLISNYFLENQLAQFKKNKMNVQEIHHIDPFLTQQEKKELEQMISKQSEKPMEGLRKTYRLLYEQSADQLNKEEILRRMYILERNDLVRSSSEIRGSMIPFEYIDLKEEEMQQLKTRRQQYETFDFSTLYRIYRKYLDRSPHCIERDQEDCRLRMIDEIMQFGQDQLKQIQLQKIMGIYQEPKEEWGEWGKVDS